MGIVTGMTMAFGSLCLQSTEAGSTKLNDAIAKKLAEFYDEPHLHYIVDEAKKGQAASGVEVLRTAETVAINVSPCSKPANVVTFIKPYKEEAISDAECSGKIIHRVQVIQR